MSTITTAPPTPTVTRPPTPLSYTPPAARPHRGVNWRVVGFLAAVGLPFLFILYMFISQAVTGGVTDRGDYAEVDLKALGNFPFNETTGTLNDVPERYRKLDGRRVVLDGFMWSPTSAGAKGTKFEFVYDIEKCCLGGPPKVQERVFARVPKGSSVQLFDYGTLVRLTGVLHVRLVRDEEGVVRSVYDMDVESAVAKAG